MLWVHSIQKLFLKWKKIGEERGLQAWKYYVKEKGDSVLEFKKKTHRKTQFGLAAFHYFFELLDRLKKVDLIAMQEKNI